MATAYIALGSNLGDRQAFVRQALEALVQAGVQVHRVSTFHETAPVGGPAGQGPYLNAAAEIETDLSPRSLLDLLLKIEHSLGRVRRERYGPRTLDLDVLLYGDQVIHEPGLEVPHPRMHERRFVLAPLAGIAPEVLHPVLRRSVRELLARLESSEATTQESWKVQEALGMDPVIESTSPPGRELTGLRALVT